MHISVIVATFNRCQTLARTLPLLLAQDFDPAGYEVIVVVDGSTDGTSDFLHTVPHRGNLHVVEQPNRGQAAAINAGLQQCRGELVLFLDDDILCGPTLVAEHASSARTGKACLVFGPVLVASEGSDALAVDWARTFCDDFFRSTVLRAPEKGGMNAWRPPTLRFLAKLRNLLAVWMSPSAGAMISSSAIDC